MLLKNWRNVIWRNAIWRNAPHPELDSIYFNKLAQTLLFLNSKETLLKFNLLINEK